MVKRINYFLLLSLLSSCTFTAKDVKSDKQTTSYDGVWAESKEENALFTIKGDSIINFEHGDRMRFKIIDDTIVIDYGDFVGRHLILKHIKDSLILQNEDESITRLYKR